MPKITQQVSSRIRTSTRRLPHSPWPSLSTTFCNLIVPLQYNHHYHTLTYLLTPKPDSSTFPAFAHTTARPFPHFHSTTRALHLQEAHLGYRIKPIQTLYPSPNHPYLSEPGNKAWFTHRGQYPIPSCQVGCPQLRAGRCLIFSLLLLLLLHLPARSTTTQVNKI